MDTFEIKNIEQKRTIATILSYLGLSIAGTALLAIYLPLDPGKVFFLWGSGAAIAMFGCGMSHVLPKKPKFQLTK